MQAASPIVALAVVSVPLTLLMAAIACRLMGDDRDRVVSRWSAAYIPLCVRTRRLGVALALRHTLLAPLAPARRRASGRDCEISSLIDALPATIDIGDHYVPRRRHLPRRRARAARDGHRPTGRPRLKHPRKRCLVPGGVRVPEGTLGINTRARVASRDGVADPRLLRPYTAWFGHPALELVDGADVGAPADARLAEHPSALRRATRLFWETARFLLPIGPVLAFLIYLWGIERVAATASLLRLTIAIPLITLGTALLPIVTALATKWLLLGRVRPGTHPLWSCWAGPLGFLLRRVARVRA